MKKINLNSAAFLVLGVFLLVTPALSQAIITSLVTAFYRNIDLLVWVNLAQNFWILNLLPKVVGATLVAGFVWKHLKTRFKCDLPKIKVQTTRLATYSLLFMLCAGLFIFADVPVSDAATTALTGYILDTPVAEYAWLIGAYSDSSFYAIDGSTWDNKVTGVGSTAWATYRTNSTALTEQVLAACTNGTIYMKDVAFDMNLFDDIPEDVRVICSYNAEYWEYINSADSSGSPYTVSVGSGVNNGYYLAQDSEGRICFASTDAYTTLSSAVNAMSASPSYVGGLLYLTNGIYPISTSLTLKHNIVLMGESQAQTIIKAADNNQINIITVWNNVTIQRLTLDGNKDGTTNAASSTKQNGVFGSARTNVLIRDITIQNTWRNGIYITAAGTSNINIENCVITNTYIGLSVSGNILFVSKNHVSAQLNDGMVIAGSNAFITNNFVTATAKNGIAVINCANFQITGNTVTYCAWHGINLSVGCQNGTVTGNTASYNTLSGIDADVYNNDLMPNDTWIVISGNEANNNGQYGIYGNGAFTLKIASNTVQSNTLSGIGISNCDNSTINDNTIDANLAHGIRISNSSNCLINNNRILDQPTTGYNGIWLTATSLNNVLQNNFITNSANYDILIDSGCDANWFTGNKITSYDDNGTSNVFTNNMVNGTVVP